MTTTENRGPTRDPADLEREADEIRANMDRTLDALEQKFSPRQLLDQSLGYLRDHRGELSRNVADTVRRNPVPALMAAAGTIWLITSALRSRNIYEPQPDDGYSRHDRAYDRVAATRGRIRDEDEAAVVDRDERVRDLARDMTRERIDRMSDRLHTAMEEQPLAMGALALALGAVIGALLPSTPYENRTVGQVRDRTLAKAKEVGEKQYENLRSKLAHEETRTTGRVN